MSLSYAKLWSNEIANSQPSALSSTPHSQVARKVFKQLRSYYLTDAHFRVFLLCLHFCLPPKVTLSFRYSLFDKAEHVGVHNVGMGGAHAVREPLVDLERAVL